ncbi:xanthine dehydrogenase molybdenum-binding subunit [Tumebacillus sp. BK434]|uniref:FAD binding domain-containing protein n=1 Tax=Tumebacillus sp. BK434 TaxID=2512169 RepID=UPI00104D5041|nr:FAD binding domain-containing protein [Tumebacillus sp. BK434]TCP55736.1 xanthine dehydrogenase molybdenum-binding subunit [Tumebacillus sp. BK434]
MISFDFEYWRPESIADAIQLYQKLAGAGKQPMYYAGGTEIISLARIGQLRTGAVIDLKGIPELNVCQFYGEVLVIGANVTLTRLAEARPFPLLGDTVRHIADHSNRNKITVGGNICGRFVYREAVLPLLLTDTHAVLTGPSGTRQAPLFQLFNGTLNLLPGEILVRLLTPRRDVELPYVTIKKTKLEEIDYPLVRLAAVQTGPWIRVAFSGVSEEPFRSREIEAVLNNASLPLDVRIEQAIRRWPAPILDDILGSAEYRAFVLHNALQDAWAALKGGSA